MPKRHTDLDNYSYYVKKRTKKIFFLGKTTPLSGENDFDSQDEDSTISSVSFFE